MAEKLELAAVAELLSQTLAEEEEADTKLTEVAEGLYGQVALGDEESDELGKNFFGREESASRSTPASAGRSGR